MADPNAPVAMWEWLDSLWGFGAGIVMGVISMLGWIAPKLRRMHEKIDSNANDAHKENDELSGELHGRVTAIEKLIIALQENHRETMRMYQRVEDQLKALNTVTDQQTKILYRMQGALKIKGDGHE